MSEPFVIVSYLATYGLIIGYAAYLATSFRRAKRR
jgi:hypothetical protein